MTKDRESQTASRDEVLKRMLKMKPKPHRSAPATKRRSAAKKDAKKR